MTDSGKSPSGWAGMWGDSVPVVARAGDDPATAVAETYRTFARLEAHGRESLDELKAVTAGK